jgi:hypothetical protein
VIHSSNTLAKMEVEQMRLLSYRWG